MANIVFIQTEKEKINNNSIESLVAIQNFSKQTNNKVYAVTFDKKTANELKNYHLDKIIYVDNTELQEYNPLYYTSAFKQLTDNFSPQIICFGHTYQTRDWVPRLSARLNISFVSDCININKKDSDIILTKQMYQGKVNADILSKNPVIVSFQSGAFRFDEAEKGNSKTDKISLDNNIDNNTIKPLEKFKESKGEVDLSSADIIVSVGRGISKEENMHIVEELSKSLSAELGSSRPVVDYGWLPHERQVGSSGQVVSPKLYFAIGISGAIQHQVGMKGSDNIIAINKDSNAPIFEIADYGIVGDLFEIVPKLTELIKNHQS